MGFDAGWPSTLLFEVPATDTQDDVKRVQKPAVFGY